MSFDPDWTIAPGETLREWAAENGLPPRTAARACDMWPALFAGICAARVPITQPLADALRHGTGISARLWLNLERRYRADLAAGKTDTSST